MLTKIARVPVVYLAGGMKGDWQDKVMAEVPDAIFIDPRKQPKKSEAAYTAWDLAGVDRSDFIFGFMESTNPGGSGLAAEFGWGARIGKHILFLEENGYPQQRFFGMVRVLANKVITDDPENQKQLLEAGIDYLRQWIIAGEWTTKR